MSFLRLYGGQFQTAAGVVLSGGSLALQLTADATYPGGDAQIVAGPNINITLDVNGNVPNVNIQSNAGLLPNGTAYVVSAYTNNGVLAWLKPQTWVVPNVASVDAGTLTTVSPSGLSYPQAVVLSPAADQTITSNNLLPDPGNTTQSLGTSGALWNAALGSATTGKLNATVFVDGVDFTTVQAAINALPSGGGTVIIPPGTYVGPTTIPSGTRLVGIKSDTPIAITELLGDGPFNLGSVNTVVLQYSANFTLANANNVALDGITLDFQNDGNLTLSGVNSSYFDIAVINTTNANPALTLTTSSQNVTVNNEFKRLILHGGSVGLSLSGSLANGPVTENHFGWVIIIAVTAPASGTYTALQFAQYCDSNDFDRVGFWTTLTAANGIVFNSSSTSADADADGITVHWFDTTQNNNASISSGYALTFNPGYGNYVRTGVLNWPSANFLLVNASGGSNTPSFQWDKSGGLVAGDPTGPRVQNLWLDGYNTVPSLYLLASGVTKWQMYLGGSNEIEFNNGTANKLSLTQNGQLFLTNTIAEYNAISTVNNGVASEIAAVHLTSQSGNIGNTALYNVPANGSYRLNWYAAIQQAASANSVLGPITLNWSDSGGGVRQTMSLLAQTGGTMASTNNANTTSVALVGVPAYISAAAGTNINYTATSLSNGGTTMQYSLHLMLESLG